MFKINKNVSSYGSIVNNFNDSYQSWDKYQILNLTNVITN